MTHTLLFEFELTEDGSAVYSLVDPDGNNVGKYCLVEVGQVETVLGSISQPTGLPLFEMVVEEGLRLSIVNNATGRVFVLRNPTDVFMLVTTLNLALDLRWKERHVSGGGTPPPDSGP